MEGAGLAASGTPDSNGDEDAGEPLSNTRDTYEILAWGQLTGGGGGDGPMSHRQCRCLRPSGDDSQVMGQAIIRPRHDALSGPPGGPSIAGAAAMIR